jgi:hypothetical protein
MIIWILEWLDLLSALAKPEAVAVSASNIVLLGYIVHCYATRKGCYLVAFLICEIYGWSNFFDFLDATTFYLVYSCIYSVLLCYIMFLEHDREYLLSVILIITFSLTSVYDSSHNNSVGSHVFVYYEYIYVFVHSLVFCQFINRRSLRNNMGTAFGWMCNKLHASDYFTRRTYNNHKRSNERKP